MSACFLYDSIPFDVDTAFLNNSWPNIFLAKLSDSGNCSADFSLFPDTSVLHHYWAVNQVMGTPPFSYHWDWGDSSFDTIPYPSHIYATAGFYTICLSITDATSCTNTVCHTNNLQIAAHSAAPVTMVQVNVVSSIPNSILENNSSDEISLFPNPATDELRIENSELKIEKVEVYNTIGEVVLNYQLSIINHQLSIDVSQLLPGIYFITVIDQAGNKVTRKVVKM